MLNRKDIAQSAVFKGILRELLQVAPKDLRDKLEECMNMKKPRADCVDTLAKATEKIYGRTALKVEGSKVTLGPLCSGGRRGGIAPCRAAGNLRLGRATALEGVL